jgi:hypothetical protein
MIKRIFISTVLSSILIFTTVFSADKDTFQFKKQPEIQQIKPKKPVKIKLKRSAEGKYSWELDGDNVDEMIRIDRRLKKLLKVE